MSWTQGQTAILTQVLLTITALLSHLGWGLLNRGSLRAQSPLSAAGSQFDILSATGSNWLETPRSPGYIIVLRWPASAVLLYTGASLDWRLGRRSIRYRGLYLSQGYYPKVNVIAHQEFELPYSYSTAQRFNLYRGRTKNSYRHDI